MKRTTLLRRLLREEQLIIAPGAFDAVSAKIIENAGFKAIFLGGFAFSASLLGKPDVGLLTMTAVLVYGFTVGDFGGEGKELLSMPWGIVSLVDLYVGFALFSGWIVYREKSVLRSVVWVVLMMVLGFWTASLYTLIALQTSGGDWQRFWMGHRAGQ